MNPFLPEYKTLRESHRDEGLQVIVKLANIELTPEKPEYDGGSWHVEGQQVCDDLIAILLYQRERMQNEHICATAIYYYDSDNISESLLQFRQQSDSDVEVGYEQDDHEFLSAIFGCEQDEPAVQLIGEVVAKVSFTQKHDRRPDMN